MSLKIGTIYIALEPLVRRRWPRTIVSWSRLVAGDLKDPLVGRDLLLGFLVGTVFALLDRVERLTPGWLGLPPTQPHLSAMRPLLGARFLISEIFENVVVALFIGFAYLFILFLLRMLLRREWAAAAAFILIFLSAAVLQSDAPLVTASFGLVSLGILVWLLIRGGLVPTIATGFFLGLWVAFPVTPRTSAWYAGIGFTAIAIMVALLLYAFRVSLGSRPLFGAARLEE